MSDDRAVAHIESEGQVPTHYERQSDNFLAQILRAATDPNVDAAKVETMANLAVRLQDRERETQFAQDLAAAMMEMPRISRRNQIIIPPKDGRPGRVQGTFASFENIDAVVRPILARHNLVIRFRLGSDQGTTATPILVHTNGHVDVGDALKVPPDTSGSKNPAQAIGSSGSYAKRYAMCAALNIVTEGEDRDGTNYPLEDDPLNDRQERLVAEAHASHKDGNYAAWWKKQTPKDRQFLIIRGVHAQLTGAPQLSGARTIPEDLTDAGPPVDERQPDPPQQAGNQTDSKPQRVTPRGWVDQLKVDVAAITTTDALDEYADAARESLSGLRKRDAGLADEAENTIRDRRAAIEG